jgi:hypothetical protein
VIYNGQIVDTIRLVSANTQEELESLIMAHAEGYELADVQYSVSEGKHYAKMVLRKLSSSQQLNEG